MTDKRHPTDPDLADHNSRPHPLKSGTTPARLNSPGPAEVENLAGAFEEDPFFTGEFDIIELSPAQRVQTPTPAPPLPLPDLHAAVTRPADIVPPGTPPRLFTPHPEPEPDPHPDELAHNSNIRARVRSEAQRSLARWRERSRSSDELQAYTAAPTVEAPWPDDPTPATPQPLPALDATGLHELHFDELDLAPEDTPAPPTAHLASLGELHLDALDHALAELDDGIEQLDDDAILADPYEASGLFVVDQRHTTNHDALPGLTGTLQARLPGLEEDLELPEPWGQYIFELRGEILAQRNPRIRAAWLHEAADVLRLTGDRWRPVAFDLDLRANELAPLYLPALRARLVECLRANDREAYEDTLEDAALQAERHGFQDDPDAQHVLGSLRFEIGVLREARGDLSNAQALYMEAAQIGRKNPFLLLNLARHLLPDHDLHGYDQIMRGLNALAGQHPQANTLRALLCCDTAELLRRAGHLERAAELYAEALTFDPSLMPAYRGIQLIGWAVDEPALEIDALRGQLAILVERGAQLARGDARRKLLKRKVAARFYRLAHLYDRAGRREDAAAALHDALGVRRHDLQLLRAQERYARKHLDWNLVANVINRQNALVTDTALRALLFVEQARAALRANNPHEARACLKHSLELAPDCLPARFELQRLMLSSADPDTRLALYAEVPRDREPDPHAPWAHDRAFASLQRGAIHELLRGDLLGAIDAYTQACAWRPTSGPWLRALERALLIAGRFPELADLYTSQLERLDLQPPARRGLHLKLARLAAAHQQFELAISHYLRLLESAEPELDHLEELGHLYRLYGWTQEAAQILEQVAALGAELAKDVGHTSREGRAALEAATRSLQWLTRLHPLNGNHADALRANDLLLELRAGDPEAVERRKTLLAARGDWGAVVELLLQQARNAEETHARRNLALEAADLCANRIRDWRQAREILTALCAEFPEDNAAHDALEALLRSREDWLALADLLLDRAARFAADERTEAVRLTLEVATLRRERLGDDLGALDALRLALALEPGFIPALWGVAEILHRLHYFQELAEHYENWMTLRLPQEVALSLSRALAWLKEIHLDQLHEAVALHRAVLDLCPEDVASRASLIRLFQRLNLPAEEAACLETLSDHLFDREDKIGLLKRAARLREALREDAADLWRRAWELDLSDREAEWGLERALHAQRAYPQLLTFYLQQARSGDPERRLYFLVKIASVYNHIERYEDAIEILRKVLALDSGQLAARFMLAETARAIKDWDTVAQAEIDLANSALDPQTRLQHLTEAARILRDLRDDPERAALLMREIVALDPERADTFDALRSIYRARRDPAAPLDLLLLLEQRLDLLTNGRERLDILREAAQLAARHAPERANAYLQQLLLDDPDDVAALDLAIQQATRLGAIHDLHLALQRRLDRVPQLDDSPQRRAQLLDLLADTLLTQLAQPENAVIALQQLLELQPEHPSARERLARARLHLGDYALACELYKDLFEAQPRPDLALTIAELLDVHLRRRQEALAFYLRAQDLEPLSGPALDGFMRLAGPQPGRATSAPMSARLLNDRLDWLRDAHRDALSAEPWSLALYAQLARIHHMRGEHDALRAIAGVVTYFGLDDQLRDIPIPPPRANAAARLLQGRGGRLSPDDLRLHLLPQPARGLRRSLLAVLWESAANVDPDDLRSRGLSRADRISERDDDPRFTRINALARALAVFGVELYHHPKDPYAVLPLFTPEPVLVVGQGILERADDPFHLFRVARALETLRDGAGLMERRDAPSILAALDDLLLSQFGELPTLPAFRLLHTPPPWFSDASRRLQRALPRRARKDLQTLVEGTDRVAPEPAEDFIDASRLAPLRTGLAVCGHFGVAADAIAGTTFSLDRETGPARTEAVLNALKRSDAAPGVEALLLFIISEDFAKLREQLDLDGDAAAAGDNP